MKLICYRIVKKEQKIFKEAEEVFVGYKKYKGIYRSDPDFNEFYNKQELVLGMALEEFDLVYSSDWDWGFSKIESAKEVFSRIKEKSNKYEIVKLVKIDRIDVRQIKKLPKNFYGFDVGQDYSDYWSCIFGLGHPGLIEDFRETELENNEILNKHRPRLNKNLLFSNAIDAFEFLDNYKKIPHHETGRFSVIGVEKIFD